MEKGKKSGKTPYLVYSLATNAFPWQVVLCRPFRCIDAKGGENVTKQAKGDNQASTLLPSWPKESIMDKEGELWPKEGRKGEEKKKWCKAKR